MPTSPLDAPVAQGANVSPFAMHPRRRIGLLLLFATLSVSGGFLGLAFATTTAGCTLLWPPAGLALAAMLLVGPSALPVIFLADLLLNATATNSVITPWPLVAASGHALESLVGWWILRRFPGFDGRFNQLRDAIALVFVAAPVAALLGGFITALGLFGHATLHRIPGTAEVSFWQTAADCSIADALSILLITPVVTTWFGRLRLTPRQAIDGGFLLLSLAIASCVAFLIPFPELATTFPLAFIPIPILVLGAMRLGPRGSSLMSLTIACIAAAATLRLQGPFRSDDLDNGIRLLWAFMAVSGGTAICLASAAAEGRDALKALAGSRDRHRESEQRFRDLFERHGSIMLLIDPQDLVVLDANDAAARFYGFSRDQLRGMPVTRINVAERDLLLETAAELTRTGHGCISSTHRLADGQERRVEVHCSAITHQGRPLLFSIVHDVTRRLRIEAEHARLERRVLQSQRLESLGLLAGTIAHDFNNLLTGIMGNVGVARRHLPADSPAAASLDTVEHAAHRAGELATQLLDFAGDGRQRAERIDLSDLVLDVLRIADASIAGKATLRVDVAAGLPAVEIDATQVRRLVMNLVTNAADAVNDARGEIRVSTGLVDADADLLASQTIAGGAAPGPYAFVEVTDTGKGMDQRTLDRIFDPYFTTKATGRGLGLAAAPGVIKAHHGALKVESSPGRGTTFRILTPASPLPASSIEAKPPAPASLQPPDPGTILVVDDEEVVRSFAVATLRAMGHKVLEAHDSYTALAHLCKSGEPVDAILLDASIHGIPGRDFLHAIRDMGVASPVILSSGYTREHAMGALGPVEHVSFLHKPYTHQALAEAIHRALQPASKA
ncbi:MAG: MASE1 domain-containing protein [Phycisphaerae bacterium]